MFKQIFVISIVMFSLVQSCWSQPEVKMRGKLPDWKSKYSAQEVETAVFAGGCFWGVEGVFEQLQGVLDVQSGYAGGNASTASYRQVGTGVTGHAESVQIIFDPDQISYLTLLDIFFTVAHNPTELNYQGPDRGTQYRSAIFFGNKTQKQEALDKIAQLEKQGIYSRPIVTEVTQLDEFYPAEEYHQDFMRLNPTHSYIEYWDIPKLKQLQSKFPELLYDK